MPLEAKPSPAVQRAKRLGESGRDFSKRILDAKSGPGKWKKGDIEYRQLKKDGDRKFRDPNPLRPSTAERKRRGL